MFKITLLLETIAERSEHPNGTNGNRLGVDFYMDRQLREEHLIINI